MECSLSCADKRIVIAELLSKMEVLWKTAVPRLRECAQTYIRME